MDTHLSNIKDEDLLRKLWQETEDFGRKKEIRAHMYKLREDRLKDFYVHEMDSKTPITSRHGNTLADHSFESLKSNEIRGTDSPMRDIKFGPITDGTGGWNVISSSETSDDGKARTEKMLATTEGVTAVDGGKKAFAGKNEELKTERYDGDANNFTHSTGESSSMNLNENIVTGDENNRRIENKTSSVSHSSNVTRSSTNTGDAADLQREVVHDHDLKSSSRNNEKTSTSHSEHQNTSSDQQRHTSGNVRLSQESSTVKEAFRLAEQPGNIISRQVERHNPTTNMIIEKKELVDGTIVTTKRYETINSDHIDIRDTRSSTNNSNTTTRDDRSSTSNVKTSDDRSVKNSNTTTRDDHSSANSNVKTHDIKHNVEMTFKTSRDEEAFKLSQQPGTIISRDVELTDSNTKMITEKKKLTDGTIVTTKRFEKVHDDSSNVHSTTRDTQSTRNVSSSDTKSTSNAAEEVRKTSKNETFRTSRDEEAFRLSQQPGKIISSVVEMTNPTTRMITEKKELNDGTIVTTKRYESISSDTQSNKSFTKEHNIDVHSKNLRNDSPVKTDELRRTTNVDQTFKTARDEEAFRLAQQPGTVISRNVEMTNPTTRMITEKKELTDGTIVTTKRYETVSSDTQSNKSVTKEHKIDVHSKNLRNDSSVKTDELRRTTNVDQTFKTARDEEAFRLAQQPGTVISRNVELTNPTTRMITEKKKLTDGTIVTTKRYETITGNETVSKNFNTENVVKKNVQKTNADNRKTDRNEDREVVEETVTKKVYDTSCHCPEKHDGKAHTREFINTERNDDNYDITSEIIVNVDDRAQTRQQDFAEMEKRREEIVRREEIKKLEQRRVEEQVRRQEVTQKKITRELDVDSAHKAFASSLRCVTPPNERVSTPNVSRNESRSNRSPSRETNISKISSSTTTIRKASNSDVRKVDDRRSTSKSSSPEKQPKKVTPDSRRSTTEIVETFEIDTKTKDRSISPQKVTQSSPKTGSPGSPRKVEASKAPRKVQPSSDRNVPKNSLPDSRDASPHKKGPRDSSPQKHSPRDSSPQRHGPKDSLPRKQGPRDSSPQKHSPRDASPSKSFPDPTKYKSPQTKAPPSSQVSTPRASSPQKSSPTSGASTPRAVSPQKFPTSKTTSRDNSPNKPTKTTKRDDEIFSSTIVIDNKEKKYRDDLKIVQTIDTKNMSATTSVSDLEYIVPDQLLTDLDSEDIQIKINVSNFNQTDDLQIKTTIHEVDTDKKKVPYHRSETFEERARKLIGVAPDSENDDDTPHYAKPTYASFPNGSANRVSEIRERKAKIEQETQEETQEIETVTKKNSVTEDFITREKNESRRSTQAFSSPDQSPTRNNSKPLSKKPIDTAKPHDRPTDKVTNVTKTVKTTETRYTSPEKKKPSTVETNKRITSDHTTETVKTRSPVRHPETHITVAKIHISPPRNVPSKSTKTTVEKSPKVAPSIRLVKRPVTDVSSTELDSDIETEHELIKNIDKGTSKSTRRKLIQSRKDSAPVTKTTHEKEKATRSVSDNIFKKTTTVQQRESSPKKDTKRPTKCVTTKTINVNTINSHTLDDVMVIDVQRAKSSREPSPNKIIPTPVRPDEVINGHDMIYPNKVTEPDDIRKQKPKVKNIPIFEEKTKQFVGLEITEVSTDKSPVILEEDEIDEHERTVINSSTLERYDRKRNSIQIDAITDEDDDEEAHLMSVSQKVNKFISTAEELKKPRSSAPFKGDDVRLEDVSEPEDDSMLTVNRKVTKFSTTTDETYDRKSKHYTEDVMTRSVDEVDENLRNDECLLSVSDKVNKFITSAEKLVSSAPQKSPELVKNIMKGTTKRVNEKTHDVNESFLTKEKVSTLTKEDRSDSKSTARTVGSDITLKSTEAIKRARAVFETNTASRDTKRHDDIMSRPSVFEAKRTPTAERKVYKETVTTKTSRVEEKSPSRDQQSPYKDRQSSSKDRQSPSRDHKSPSKDHQSPSKDRQSPSKERQSPSKDRPSPVKDYDSKSPSPSSPRRGSSERTPAYMRDHVSTKKDLFEKRISSSKLEIEMNQHKSVSPQNSVDERNRSGSEEAQHHSVSRKHSSDKHYMSHTVASLEHVNNERREFELNRTSQRESRSSSRRDSETRSPTKFHRNISESTNEEAPRTPTKFGVELKRTDSSKNTQPRRMSSSVETIIIEEIFDLIELEKLLEIVVGYEQRRRIRAQIREVKKTISERKTSVDTKTSRTEKFTSSYSSPTRKSRDEPVMQTKVTQRTVTEKPDKITRDDSRSQKVTTTTTTTTTRQSGDKPREVTQVKTTRVTNEKPTTPRGIIENLNKNSKSNATENVKIVRKTSATSSTQQKANSTREVKNSSTRESRTDTDCVTSSYGVGPTDSNGLPLFGLRALKKKAPTTTKESKTTGTVFSEVSYSENGRPATVERKTTKYSTDPSDLSNEIDQDYKTSTSERKSSRGGVYSVTKYEKFQDDAKKSSVKSTSVPSSRVIRRGSVKELKEKFVRKDSSSKVTESSSKTDTKRTSVDYRDSESESESYRVSKQYKSSSKESKSFLNSNKKASNVQEVLSYMRNADDVHEDGDSKDDAEARALLNKFLGATALMSGIENNSGLSKEFLSGGGASTKKNQNASSTSKVTKTVSSYSTAKSHDINDIWDVELLKKLLEATTNYDERRKIRARLRQVMADQEACADIVKQLTAELDSAEGASGEKKEEETMTKTSSEVQQKGDRIIKTTTTEVITKSTMEPQKKMSPFAKFRQLDRQNSLPNSPSPKTPSTPTTPGSSKINGPMFSFTDPALQRKAATVKETLLMWCQIKTKEYENVKIENFSSSWSDGLAFAALIHHFLPDAFDYNKLTPKERRHNFTLAFQIADDKAGIAPLLDVDDMVMYRKPDWKCVFCYVQSIYRRFRNED